MKKTIMGVAAIALLTCGMVSTSEAWFVRAKNEMDRSGRDTIKQGKNSAGRDRIQNSNNTTNSNNRTNSHNVRGDVQNSNLGSINASISGVRIGGKNNVGSNRGWKSSNGGVHMGDGNVVGNGGNSFSTGFQLGDNYSGQ